MPCPYFEPRQALENHTQCQARLPLIAEFDGVCRARPEALPVPAGARLRLCNQGNARGECAHFPEHEARSAIRFDVLRRSAADLELLLVEESGYAPLAWRRLTFTIAPERIEPEPEEVCQRAQLLAFCRSYLRRYP